MGLTTPIYRDTFTGHTHLRREEARYMEWLPRTSVTWQRGGTLKIKTLPPCPGTQQDSWCIYNSIFQFNEIKYWWSNENDYSIKFITGLFSSHNKWEWRHKMYFGKCWILLFSFLWTVAANLWPFNDLPLRGMIEIKILKERNILWGNIEVWTKVVLNIR